MRRTALFKMFSTHTRICIIGGGTGGLNLSTHLCRIGKIPASDIRIFDGAQTHYYQPGWTMLGSDLCEPELTYRPMAEIIPSQFALTQQNVARVDPDKNTIYTDSGEEFTYDHVIFCSGIKNDWHKIKGAKEALDNPNSKVGSIYDFKYAEKMRYLGRDFSGGKAIFTEPVPPIKCAGAPQKTLYLWTEKWRKKGIPAKVEFIKAPAVLFGVPKYSESLTKVAAKYDVKTTFKNKLIEVKGDVAVFEHTETGEITEKHFDFLHVIPPMSPQKHIADSGLGDAAGYLDVNKFSLQHTKYKNVWGLGDCTNSPNSKTAAAVFSQTETLVENMKSYLTNPNAPLPNEYEGYSCCPLFTGDGKLMLAEFKYGGVVDETFFSNQEKPRRIFYFLKRYFFPHVYWHVVPRGFWGGRRGFKIDI